MDRRYLMKGALATGGVVMLGSTLSRREPARIAGQGYTLVFEDDFNTFDRSVWNPHPWYASRTPDHSATVANSILTIRTTAAEDYWRQEWATIGPRAASRPFHPQAKTWQYGYFEARMRYTNHRRNRPAFWLLNHEGVNAWPEARNCNLLNAEYDIVEPGIGNNHPDTVVYQVLHKNTGGVCSVSDETRQFRADGSGFSNWHVWAGLWGNDGIALFLDDQAIGLAPTYESTDQPMYMILDTKPDTADSTPLPEALELQVDWVRVWQQLDA